MAGYKEDDEIVVSIDLWSGTALVSSTRPSFSARCQAKWGPPTESHKRERNGAVGSCDIWRDLPMNLISLVPKSKADRAKATEIGKKRWASKHGPTPPDTAQAG